MLQRRVVASFLVSVGSWTRLLPYLFLIYHTSRPAERRLGTRQYSLYLLAVVALDRFLSLLVLAGSRGVPDGLLQPGPWVFAMASVGWWWANTPTLGMIRLRRCEVGDKLFPGVVTTLVRSPS